MTDITISTAVFSSVSRPSEISDSNITHSTLSESDIAISDPTYTSVSAPSVP